VLGCDGLLPAEIQGAGGLHPAVAARAFRVGHMGVDGRGELLTTLSTIEQGLGVTSGAGITAAQAR
jgi:aspartate aminotransferase-like enzyme